MRRPLKLAAITFVILIPAFAAFATFYFQNDYYSDGTYTTMVGQAIHECDDPPGYYTNTGDTSTSYRIHYFTNCDNNNSGHACEQLINGAWTVVQCP
jgi:hypothetical protein